MSTASADRVLVVGAGFVGRATARHLVGEGRDVRVLARHADRALDGVRWVIGDAAAQHVLLPELHTVDAVVWCAGRLLPVSPPSALEAVDDLRPLTCALESLAACGGTRLVFISSGGTLYGPHAPRPTPETTPLSPTTPYSTVKAQAEERIALHKVEHGLDATILRVANLYGPRQPTDRPQGIIGHAFDCVVEQRPLVVRSDETSTRDYLHVDDLARVVSACVDREQVPDVMNVGSGCATELGRLLALIRQIAGPLSVVRGPAEPTDLDHSELHIGRLRAFMGRFEPRSLPEGLAETWQSWRN